LFGPLQIGANMARVNDDELRRAPDFEIDAGELWQGDITDAARPLIATGQVRLQNVEPRT
jgi:hypothetical protein